MAEPIQIPIIKIQLTSRNLRGGARLLLFIIYVLIWIMEGAWRASGDFAGALRTLGFGMVGLVTAALLNAIWERAPLGSGTLMVTLMGLVPVIVPSIWISFITPQLRTYLAIRGNFKTLAIESLATTRPVLPAHIQLEGQFLTERMMAQLYEIRDNENNQTRTETVYFTPFVEAGWTTDDPVYVVAEHTPFGAKAKETVQLTGILYPVALQDGEQSWSNRPGGIDADLNWFQANAQFRFNPDQFYILSDSSPGELLFMIILFSIFTLAVIITIFKIALD